jgi:hypothetical protein
LPENAGPVTFNFAKALYFTSTNSKTVFTLLGEVTMGTETDAGYKVRGSYSNSENDKYGSRSVASSQTIKQHLTLEK